MFTKGRSASFMSPSYPLEDALVQVSVVGGDAIVGADFPDVFPLEFNFEMGY